MVYEGIIIGLAALVALWGVVTYNRFVTLRRRVGEAWSGISVQLKRRHDLVPNCVEMVKGYAAHESSLFSEVARVRAQSISPAAPSKDLARSEGELAKVLGRLMAISEAYPELKANKNFIQLQETITETEDQLQMARRYYNGTVREYMILHETFPSMLVAKAFSFAPESFFELEDDAEKALPIVSL